VQFTVQVTIDGRVLIFKGHATIELVSTNDTREMLDALTEARDVQAQINGDMEND
jgi:DNA/RNA endonuclease YhcR with UshA esterase domain